MEFINKIELCGIVSNLSLSEFQNKRMAAFNLLVETTFKGKDNSVAIESTWFSCRAFESDSIDIEAIQKGNTVHLTGRVRERRYVNKDGNEVRFFEVICQSLELVE